MKVLSYLLLIG